MNPKRISIPALRLPDGKVLKGRSHIELAFEVNLERNAIVGHVNYEGVFKPIFPIDEEIVPKLKCEKDALEFAESCSKGERDACERLSEKNDLLKLVVTRWDQLKRLPMVVASKRLDNNYIYLDGVAHGTNVLNHPDITYTKTDDPHKTMAIPGFLHDDGRFLSRQQAANVCVSLGGICMENRLLSGEEWIPPLNNEEQAEDFGKNMHYKAYGQIKQRSLVFKSLKKHSEHIKLLEVALEIYKREINRRNS
jgi:hypothetical protein